MITISYLSPKGEIQTWIATEYIRAAWDIYLRESKVIGVADFSHFCRFFLIILEVDRLSKKS